MSFKDVRLIELPKIPDPRGNLTFIEGSNHIPFNIKRVFYLYDVPGGESRGGHALKTTDQFIIAASGSFSVVLDSGTTRQRFTLNRSYMGLYLPPMIWRELEDFSSGAVCLVLASENYNADDYYTEYDGFKEAVKQGAGGKRKEKRGKRKEKR
jgi:hypothetical protein